MQHLSGTAQWDWKQRSFWLRLLLSYLLVPSLCFLPLTLSLASSDWLELTVLYSVFGFGAMVVLGTPLMLLFSRFQIRSFVAFSLAGALCVALMYVLIPRLIDRSMLPLFLLLGLIAGYLFRLILFGFKR